MKIGLIARSEYARGLAIQSRNFYDNMPVEKVLLIKMRRPDCALRDDWYDPAHTTQIDYNDWDHTLPEEEVRAWLEGLDVVFTVETPYDWRLPRWARQMGVKVVVQGNPEFYRHDQMPEREQPDAWWWPTSWRLEYLPAGRIVPVPMPEKAWRRAEAPKPLRICHVVGKRAVHDRNGTDIFIQVLRSLREPTHVTIWGLDNSVPQLAPLMNRNITVEVRNDGVDDRWEMYHNQHILVMPRRYGGLCLPALEAAAVGVIPLMPDVSPNREFTTCLVEPRGHRMVKLPAGPTPAFELSRLDIAERLNLMAGQNLQHMAFEIWKDTLHWDEGRRLYEEEFERVLNQG